MTSFSFDTVSESRPKPIDKRLFAIPAWLDLTETVLKNIAATLIAASIV
jgi:hypothetical protein